MSVFRVKLSINSKDHLETGYPTRPSKYFNSIYHVHVAPNWTLQNLISGGNNGTH